MADMVSGGRRKRPNVVSLDLGDLIEPVRGIARANSLSASQAVRLLIRTALTLVKDDPIIRVQIPASSLLRPDSNP